MSQIQFEQLADEICSTIPYNNPSFVAKGAFKETFLVVDEKNVQFALKIFDPNKYNKDRTSREIDAMQNCDHPNIATLVEFSSQMLSNQKIHYTIEEFYDGGDLKQQGCLHSDIIRNIAIDIAEAIKYLRTHNIVHRDIKPENIMFRNNCPEAILVDFGLVRKIGELSITNSWVPTGPGTPFYSSPEQLNNDKGLIDWRTDQYSLGIMIATLLFQNHPFQNHKDDIAEAIVRVGKRESLPEKTKISLINKKFNFVVKMLEPWSIKRFNCPDILIEEIKKGRVK